MSPFSWQCQNLCLLSLAFIIDWRVVASYSVCNKEMTKGYPTLVLRVLWGKVGSLQKFAEFRDNFLSLGRKIWCFMEKFCNFCFKTTKFCRIFEFRCEICLSLAKIVEFRKNLEFRSPGGEQKSVRKKPATTLQSIMNAKLSKHRFCHCYENGLIKTIKTIPHNLYVSVKLTSLYCGSRLILIYPNPK